MRVSILPPVRTTATWQAARKTRRNLLYSEQIQKLQSRAGEIEFPICRHVVLPDQLAYAPTAGSRLCGSRHEHLVCQEGGRRAPSLFCSSSCYNFCFRSIFRSCSSTPSPSLCPSLPQEGGHSSTRTASLAPVLALAPTPTSSSSPSSSCSCSPSPTPSSAAMLLAPLPQVNKSLVEDIERARADLRVAVDASADCS